MSLREIFEAIWNSPIPWLWIFGGLGAFALVGLLVVAFIGNEIRKEGQNVQKP